MRSLVLLSPSYAHESETLNDSPKVNGEAVVELVLKSRLDHLLPKVLHGLLPLSTSIQLLEASGSELKTGLKPRGEEEEGGIPIVFTHGGLQVLLLCFGCDHL